MPNIHTPERLRSESWDEYQARRRRSRAEVRRMCAIGPDGIKAALRAAPWFGAPLRQVFTQKRS